MKRWWAKLGYVVVTAICVYSLTAVGAKFSTDHSRAGCERGNTSRHELYQDNLTAIHTNTAISKALDSGPNAAGVKAALAGDSEKARASQVRLTIGDYEDAPWAVNCVKQYPYPLPWPGLI